MDGKKHYLRAPVISLPDTVLFPWTIVHLELKDKEHIKIIKESMKQGGNVVICLRKNPFAPRSPFCEQAIHHIYQTGTIGRPIIIDETDQDTWRVVFKGQERVYIKELVQNLPTPIYELELSPDLKDSKPPQEKITIDKTASLGGCTIERLANLLKNWGERNIVDSLDRDNFFSSLQNIHHLINNISTHLIQDAEIKQILLESLDINERIQILDVLFPHDMVDSEDPIASQALKEYEAIETKMIMSQ